MNDTTDKQKVIDKVRKLLALSTSSNEHEAALAMERAQAMLLEHNLDMSQISEQKQSEWLHEAGDAKKSEPWMRTIYGGVSKFCFCGYYYTSVRIAGKNRERAVFIGEKHNVTVAFMMAEYLIDTVIRLSRQGTKDIPEIEHTRYKKSFRTACGVRLWHRMKKITDDLKAGKSEVYTGKNLPMVISQYALVEQKVAAEFEKMNVKSRPSRMSMGSSARGSYDGQRAGDQISLDKQIGGKQKPVGALT